MGLAGPRNRTKIGADPRNTNWSNNTDRFGHRILTTLGWQPGNTLGDTSSLYHQSGHITTASAAGVKIVLKDDNLGIGCNKKQHEDECVGLDGLQSLLGRLNGKGDDQLGKEAETRDRMRREIIVSERYGMRFVRGETYVSSDIETLMKRIEGEKKDIEGKKVMVGSKETKEERKKKKQKKKEIKKEDTESSGDMVMTSAGSSDTGPSADSRRGVEKKDIKHEKSSSESALATPTSDDGSDSKPRKRKQMGEDDTGRSTKDKKVKISKKSKNGETHEQRKERRALEKGEKEARKAEKEKRREEKKKKRKSPPPDSSDSSEGESTLATSGTATPSGYAALVGRQAVRHRYIAAKRSAVMDAKALNEIFMIKA